MDRQPKSEAIIERIRAIRLERFGDDVASLACQLEIPAKTWLNYEQGVVMPGVTMLHFLEICEADPSWLLHGAVRKGKRSSQDA